MNWDDFLAGLGPALSGGVDTYLRLRAYRDAQRERRDERERAADERLADINRQIQLAAMQGSWAVERDRAEQEAERAERTRKAEATAGIRDLILGSPDVPMDVRGRLRSLTPDQLAELDASDLRSTALDPYTVAARMRAMEELRQQGREDIVTLQQAGADRRAGRGPTVYQRASLRRQFADRIVQAGGGKAVLTDPADVEEAEALGITESDLRAAVQRYQDARARRGSAGVDLDALMGSQPGSTPPRLPPVTVTGPPGIVEDRRVPGSRPMDEGVGRLPPGRTPADSTEEQRRALIQAINDLRARGVPKKDWPARIVIDAIRLGILGRPGG